MPSLTDIEGVGSSLAAACVKNKYRSIAKIATAKPDELSAIPGISKKSAKQIIASAKSLLAKSPSSKNETKKAGKPVSPPKVATRNTSGKPKAKEKKRAAGKANTASGSKEQKMSKTSEKAKEKVKELKKKIKKLKKEKKKIIAKDKKRQKKEKEKKSSKKK